MGSQQKAQSARMGVSSSATSGPLPKALLVSVDAAAFVGAIANDTSLPLDVEITDAEGNSAVSNEVTVTATAVPSWSLRKLGRQPLVREVEDDSGNGGFLVVWPITLESSSPTGRGVEGLQGDFSFEDDLTDILTVFPNARLLDFVPIGGPVDACGPASSAFETAPWGRIGITTGATSGNSVADSGSWSCTRNGGVLEVSVTAAELASGVAPSLSTQGRPLSPRGIIVSGQIALFLPFADLPGEGTYTVTNRVVGFAGTSLSGAGVADTALADDAEAVSLTYTTSGFISPETGVAEGLILVTKNYLSIGPAEIPGLPAIGALYGMPGQSMNAPSSLFPIIPGSGTNTLFAGDGLREVGGRFVGVTGVTGDDGSYAAEGEYHGLCLRFDNTPKSSGTDCAEPVCLGG